MMMVDDDKTSSPSPPPPPPPPKSVKRKLAFYQLSVAYSALQVWLGVGMIVFHLSESPNELIIIQPAAALTMVMDAPVETMLIDNNNRNTQYHQSSPSFLLLENVNIISANVFTNETSTYTMITFTRSQGTASSSSSSSPTSSQQIVSSAKQAVKWDLSGSLLFSLSVVTTIGYGSLAPETDFGKFFCVIYAIVGIPLCFHVISLVRRAVVILLTEMQTSLWRLCRFIRQTTPLRHEETDDADARLKRNALIATGLISSLTCAALIFGSSGVIHSIEGWSYFSSLYYTFITMTTIGFGNSIAGQNIAPFNNPWLFQAYRMFLSFFILSGMSCSWLVICELEKAISQFTRRSAVFSHFIWQRIKAGLASMIGLGGGDGKKKNNDVNGGQHSASSPPSFINNNNNSQPSNNNDNFGQIVTVLIDEGETESGTTLLTKLDQQDNRSAVVVGEL